MVKNYPFIWLLFLALQPPILFAQEIKIFTSDDFDLRGAVKSCLVSTDYGKEEYEFDKVGRLTKSVTRHSDDDYDITYYKYLDGELAEKRLEIYRDKTFDRITSIANFYAVDTLTDRKVTEKIVAYDKTFLDQYEYFFDEHDRLVKIIRSNGDGIDETVVEYTSFKDEDTVNYLMNDVLEKSVRTSYRKATDKSLERVVLTKKFLNGEPNTATEEITDAQNNIIKITTFFYDLNTKQFSPESSVEYTYDGSGILLKKTATTGTREDSKEYLYQFDNGEEGNWIKQIVTPDNAYTTRKISYFETSNEVGVKE